MATPQLIPGNSKKIRKENAAKLRDWAFWYRLIWDWRSATECDRLATALEYVRPR